MKCVIVCVYLVPEILGQIRECKYCSDNLSELVVDEAKSMLGLFSAWAFTTIRQKVS